MGTANTRIQKVSWLKSYILKFFDTEPNGIIDKSKLLAQFSLANHSTERTGEEILRLLEKTGFIKIENNNILKGDDL